MMADQSIGQKMKALREQAGLSQAQIAQFLELDQSTVSKCEKGERQFQVDHLERLGSLYGFTLAGLLGEEGQVKPLRFAFRTGGIQAEDLAAIADIHKLALNLDQMRMLLQENAREIQS